MKKFLIIILAVCAVFAGLNSCKKTGASVNPLTDVKNLAIGSYLVIDSTINPNLNVLNSTSSVGVIVHQYPLGETIDHIVLYATLGTSTDTTTWKLVKTVPYTAGSKVPLSATTAELATAFGVPASSFAPGSVFTFFPRAVTKSGKPYDINNAGDNGGGGLITGPAYASGFSFTVYVVCPFTGGMTGTYKVIKDDWADWSAGDMVQVTDAGTNKIDLSQVYPGVPAGGHLVNHIIVNVDPATGTATVPKVVFGYYSNPATQYSAEGAGANDVAGYVFSCTGFITLSLTIDGDTYKLVLQKQ